MARIGDFTFPDFSSFSHQHAEAYPVDATGLVPLNTNHAGMYNNGTDGTTSSPNSGLASPSDSNDRKRSADAMLEGAGHGTYGSISSASGQAGSGFEDASRLAAEEDKRRRNTAASARFRVKKKQREQALEKSAKEMSDKVAALEGRINQLETENKWLKNLVMEKNDDKEDLAALWKKFSQENADRRAASAAAKAEAAGAGGVQAKKEVVA